MKSNDFYAKILNIKQQDCKKEIYGTVKNVLSEIPSYSEGNLDRMCHVIAQNIHYELKKKGIKSYRVDLTELIGIDHEFVVAEYLSDSLHRILIDPSYSQFMRRNDKNPNSFYPAEKIDEKILNSLFSSGTVELNSQTLSNYLSSFGKKINIDIEEFMSYIRLLRPGKVFK